MYDVQIKGVENKLNVLQIDYSIYLYPIVIHYFKLIFK